MDTSSRRVKDVSDGADTPLAVTGMRHRAGNALGDVFPDGGPCLGARTTLGTSGDVPEGMDMPFSVSGASFGRVDASQGR